MAVNSPIAMIMHASAQREVEYENILPKLLALSTVKRAAILAVPSSPRTSEPTCIALFIIESVVAASGTMPMAPGSVVWAKWSVQALSTTSGIPVRNEASFDPARGPASNKSRMDGAKWVRFVAASAHAVKLKPVCTSVVRGKAISSNGEAHM